MYENKPHSVPNRIVSFHQPYLRPIVRGKAKASTEFGAKLDVSQAQGFLRIERLSFDTFNESEDLIPAVEWYKEHTGITLSEFWRIKYTAPERTESFVKRIISVFLDRN